MAWPTAGHPWSTTMLRAIGGRRRKNAVARLRMVLRQVQVYALWAKGERPAAIAGALQVSPGTVYRDMACIERALEAMVPGDSLATALMGVPPRRRWQGGMPPTR